MQIDTGKECDRIGLMLGDGQAMGKYWHTYTKARSGFTLIEMLVVVAIIGILASIITPSIMQALSSAQRTVCMNNLRQISFAEMMYLDDYDKKLNPATEHAFQLNRFKYKGYNNGIGAIFPSYLTDPAVLICPDASSLDGTPVNTLQRSNYLNYETSQDCYASYAQSLTEVRHPDLSNNPGIRATSYVAYMNLYKNVSKRIPMAWDCDYYGDVKHQLKGMNTVYWDLSVKWINYGQNGMDFEIWYLTTFYYSAIQYKRAGTMHDKGWQLANNSWGK